MSTSNPRWQAAEDAGDYARELDRSKGAGRVHASDRDPGHFADLDDDARLLGGPKSGPRRVLSLNCIQPNLAAAVVIASQNFSDPAVVLMLLVIMLSGSIWVMYHLDQNMMPMAPHGTSPRP